VIAVSGDIGVEEALSAVRKFFGDLPERKKFVPVGPMEVPPRPETLRAEERREKQQAHFVIGYTGARFTDPDRYAMDVLGAALAGQGGRLFTNLRDKKSLAYSVTSFSSEQVDPGFSRSTWEPARTSSTGDRRYPEGDRGGPEGG
jgi:zinc protease